MLNQAICPQLHNIITYSPGASHWPWKITSWTVHDQRIPPKNQARSPYYSYSVNRSNPQVSLKEQMLPLQCQGVSQTSHIYLYCATATGVCVQNAQRTGWIWFLISHMNTNIQYKVLQLPNHKSLVSSRLFYSRFAIYAILILFVMPPTEAQVITYVQHQSALQYSST